MTASALLLFLLLQSPQEGAQVQIGSDAGWRGAVALAAAQGMLYTIDSKGSLWRTDRYGERVRFGRDGEWAGVSRTAHSESIVCAFRQGAFCTVGLQGGGGQFGPPGSWPEPAAMAALDDSFYVVDKTGAMHVQQVRDALDSPPRRLAAAAGTWSGTVVATGWKGRIWSIDDKGFLYRSTDDFKRVRIGDGPHWAGARWLGATFGSLVTLDGAGSLHKTDDKGGRTRIGEAGAWKLTKLAVILRGDLWTITNDGFLFRTTLLSGPADLADGRDASVTLVQLRAMVERAWKTVTNTSNESTGEFWISAPRPGKTPVNINFLISSDRSYVWLSAYFGKPGGEQLKKSADFLRANAAIRPCQFYLTEEGTLALSLPIDNRGVTLEVLRENLDLFIQCATDTEPLWNPRAAKK